MQPQNKYSLLLSVCTAPTPRTNCQRSILKNTYANYCSPFLQISNLWLLRDLSPDSVPLPSSRKKDSESRREEREFFFGSCFQLDYSYFILCRWLGFFATYLVCYRLLGTNYRFTCYVERVLIVTGDPIYPHAT